MATVDQPRSKRRRAATHEAPPVERKKKSRAFRYGSLFMLLLLAVACYFAPAIVASTPLRQWALENALQLDGSLDVQSVSLGWFSPVEAEGFEIRDTNGETVVQLPMLRTNKSLIALLLDLSDLGEVELEQPHIHVVFGERDSNLERIFAELIEDESESLLRLKFKIVGGSVLVDDLATQRQFRIDDLNASGSVGGEDSLAIAATGQFSDRQQPGTFKCVLQTRGTAENPASLASGKVDCETSALPLEVVEPILRRYVDRAQLTGRFSTRLAGTWGTMAKDGEASLQGESLISNLAFSAKALGRDRIELQRVEMPCHIVQNGERIEIEQLAIDCELGKLALAGSFKQGDLSSADVAAALARENYQLKGHLDLAQLARLLPSTLTIRENTEITSGRVDLAVDSRQQPEGMTWSGKVSIDKLGAQADGRALTWNNPLSVEFATHETKDAIVLDRALCVSSFLQLDASGTIDDATATATFDLSRLVAELKQFTDLNGVQLAGRGTGKLGCKRGANDQFAAQAECQARGFQFTGPGGRAWHEDNVVARLSLDGQMQGGSLTRVDRAELIVEAGDERLQSRLEQPLDKPATAAWPLQCSWRGPLAAWNARLEHCLNLPGWDLAGAGALQASLRCTSEAVEIVQAKGDVTQLRVWGHGNFITEPVATLTAAGRCDLKQGKIDLASASLKSGTTTAEVRQLAMQSGAKGWSIARGTTQLNADLAQLYRWRHDPRAAAEWQVDGRLQALAELKYADGVTTATADGSIEQLQVLERGAPVAGRTPAHWREAKIVLAAAGRYRADHQRLELDKLQLASAALACDAAGQVSMADQGGDVNLKGTLEYDWQQLAPLWRQFLGDSVQIAGRQSRTFALNGRLTGPITAADSWRQVTGEASIGWTAINLYGLQVSQGEIGGKLADGQVRPNPIDLQISRGRFTLTPVVRLSPGPAEMFLSQGPLLTDVHLSPEICARGLKFVAPVLAETTVADGTFSVSLDGGRVPLADPTTGDLSGRMAIRGQVQAGPVAREFMLLVNELTSILRKGSFLPNNEQAAALMTVDSSNVEFRMVNRRIYHRGLKFTAGAVPITTHGSVGFDETIALVAEVPIQATFLGRDLSLGALEGRTVQIPIGGTLGKPKLDRGALQNLIGQMIENTARGALLDQVNRQFERLLPVQK